ncbi:MAG: hypothetical protein ACRC5M_04660 [Anaeroplasmataceae bacterium]
MPNMESKEMALRNLASDITAEMREKILSQPILTIPQDNYLNENYIGTAGTESVFDIDARVNEMSEKSEKLSKKGILSSITFGMWKTRQEVREKEGKELGINDISLRIGSSPVLNPPWQFNELDDVRSNITYPNMGRVYLTYIYSNFPILVFQPGREKMNANLLTFFTKGIGHDHKVLNDYIRNGGKSGLLGTIRLGLINIKNTTLGILEGALGLMGLNFADASKFITFKPAMRLYRKMATNLLREFAADLGLLDLTQERSKGTAAAFDVIRSDKDNYKDKMGDADFESTLEGFKTSGDEEREDSVFGDAEISTPDKNANENARVAWGGDFITSVGEKITDWYTETKETVVDEVEKLASTYRGTIPRLDVLDMVPSINFQGENPISKWAGDVENSAYLPFLCQSNITISETFSNATKDHPIVSEINSMSEEVANNKGIGGASKIVAGARNLLTGGGGSLGDLVNSAASNIATKALGEISSNASEMGMIMNGDGRMSIPEIWASSNYSRNYSVDFKFTSPTGDIVSIFENVYIPYLLLLVLTAPLQTGYNSYISPFVIKVFSKGLFSIDMGMIENLSVTRGDGANDRTRSNFPRSIKVNVTVKDLSPVMMLSLGNGAFWKYRRANSSLGEYIATMCNLSLSDRFDIGRKFDRYWALMTASVRDAFSLTNIGYNIGSSFLFKPVQAWNRNRVTVDTVNTKDIYY